MKKVKEMKKSLKFVLLLIFVIGSFALTSIPKTYSRFVVGGDNALVYKAQLYNMYTEYPMEPIETTLEKAKFEFTFIPNKAIASNVKDRYEIVIPDTCTFDGIITNASNPTINKNLHTHTITYEPGMDRSKTSTVTMTCMVNPNNEYVEFSAKINEIIVQENRKLAYIKYNYKEKYTDYLKNVEIEIENPKVIPNSENIYDIFIKWITAYAKSVGRETEILAYVKNTYPNKEALVNPNNFNTLLGFKIDYSSARDEYTFTILENFVGYARMYYASKNSKFTGNEVPLYFSTINRNVLNEAFQNYLNLYVYPKDTTSINKVYNYVTIKQGIFSVIFYGNQNISGLQLVSHNSATLDTELKLTKNMIIAGSNEQQNKPPEVPFGNYFTMLADFGDILTTQGYTSGTVLRQSIYDMVKSSITKNCTVDKNKLPVTTPPIAFTDYFAQKNNNEYILIKVWSEATSYNYLDFETISIPSNMTIAFENTTDNRLKISIAHTTKDSVMDIVSYLNTYFKTNITESNVTVIVNTGNQYAIEYTITK